MSSQPSHSDLFLCREVNLIRIAFTLAGCLLTSTRICGSSTTSASLALDGGVLLGCVVAIALPGWASTTRATSAREDILRGGLAARARQSGLLAA
jgi:hypothetical protein